METSFRIFPFPVNDADIIILEKLASDGIKFFEKYLSKMIENDYELDRYYFTNYLNYYLFENLLEFDHPWKSLIEEIKINKHYLQLIDFIDLEKNKQLFAKTISLTYKEKDAHTVVLYPKIFQYITEEEYNKVLDMHLINKTLDLVPYLSDHQSQNLTLAWTKRYYTNNLRYKNFTSIDITEYTKLGDKMNEMCKTTLQVYDFFHIICTLTKSREDAIYSGASLLQSLFHMVHDFMELSILNLQILQKTLKEALIEMRERLEMIPQENESSREILRLKINFFDNMSIQLSNIDIDDNKCMKFFRDYSITWLNKKITSNSSHNYDNIITNVIDYFINSKNVLYFDHELYQLCINIIQSNESITGSIDIKAKTAMLISSHFNTLDSCVKIHILKDVDNFVKILIDLFLDLTSNDNYEIYNYQQEIIHLLSPYKQTIYDIVDPEKVQRFIHRLIELYDLFYKGFTTLVRRFYNLDNGIQSDNNHHETLSKNDMLKSMFWYQNSIFMFDIYFNQESFQEKCLDVGNRDRIALLIGKKLEILCGPDKKTLSIHQEEKYFSPLMHLKNTFALVYGLHKNEQFQKALIQETHFLKTKYIKKMAEVLLRKHTILLREYDELQEFIQIINKGREKEKIENEREIPEEFLDPIMGSLIEHAVMLPNTDMFIERDVILRHLLTSQDNPFNREPLTKTDLEEFNSRPEIKEKVAEFQRRLDAIR